MRKLTIAGTVILTALLLAALPAAADPPPRDVPLTVWLVLDRSWSNRDSWQELQSIARSVVHALRQGDRIRVVATTVGEPRIVVLAQLTPDSAIRKGILGAIAEVKPKTTSFLHPERRSFFGRLFSGEEYRYSWTDDYSLTNVKQPLELPLSVVKPSDPASARKEVVVFLTRAQWTSDQVQECLAANEKLKAAGLTLIVTGERGAAHRLALAAARGEITYCELDEAAPADWVANARLPVQTAPLAKVEQQRLPSIQPLEPPTSAEFPPEKPKQAPLAPPPEDNKERAVAKSPGVRTPTLTPAPGVASEPALAEQNPSSPKEALELSIPVATPSDKEAGIVTIPSAPAPVASSSGQGSANPLQIEIPPPPLPLRPDVSLVLDAAEPMLTSQQALESEKAASPKAPTRAEAQAKSAPAEPALDGKVSAENSSTGASSDGRPWWSRWYVWTGVAVLLSLLTVLALDITCASRKGPASDQCDGVVAQPVELVAKVNGSDHVLGIEGDLGKVHIGAGAGNLLRVTGKGIAERHLELRAGPPCTLRNLAATPVEVNGQILATKRRAELEFPAVVRIGDEATFTLFRRPVAAPEPVEATSNPMEVVS